MVNTINTVDQMIMNNQIINSTKTLILRALLIFLILFTFGQAYIAEAQVVKHNVSEVTTTAKHYNYTYNISKTQYKIIEYILVRASNGDIKSAFNACDVCFPEHKGYSQSVTKLRCNNCGNSFDIDALGSQGSGGCWPGHLAHTLEGDSVVINISDLIKGEYYFLELISGVTDFTDIPVMIDYNNNELKVNLSDKYPRFFKIFNLDGRLCKNITNTSDELKIDISDLSSGIYYILAEFDGKPFTKSFYISR